MNSFDRIDQRPANRSYDMYCFCVLSFVLSSGLKSNVSSFLQKVEELDKRLAAITVICRPLTSSATAGKAGNKPPEGDEKGEEEQVKAAAAEVEGEGRVVGLKLKWADDSEELLGSMAFRSLLETIMYIKKVLDLDCLFRSLSSVSGPLSRSQVGKTKYF
jgi:hypothetical protein